MKRSGEFEKKRGEQNLSWMWSYIMDTLKDNLITNKDVNHLLSVYNSKVRSGEINPTKAGEEILNCFYCSIK